MDLNDIIPYVSSNWVIKNDYLMFKKYEHIPVCFISEEDIIYIFLDLRVHKPILKLVKYLIDNNIEFYFTSPELSNPKGIDNKMYHYKIIKHYLISYTKDEFFDGFKKINFDLINNMVKWTEKENCFDLVKSIYEAVHKLVNSRSYNLYNNINEWSYSSKIREEFHGLYRHIQISKII